jgi:hypothetical protein
VRIFAPRYRLVWLAVPVVIFLIVYFAVIKPNNNAANKAVKAGEHQVQQVVHHPNASGADVPAGVRSLAACITAAGANPTQLQACAAQFKQ